MKPVLRKGNLTKWNDNRGFGFIQPSDGSKEVFLHNCFIYTISTNPFSAKIYYLEAGCF
jgi:hypothetical protein